MAAKKFKFVSPGIFLNEIDNSQLPREPREVGPMIIGRTQRGPAMRPVRVDSFADYVEMFGEPLPGGKGVDVWREGNTQTPLYASYAAQAWLKNSSTCNVVRLLGKEHSSKSSGGEAGWNTTKKLGMSSTGTPVAKDNVDYGGAYGLWVFPGRMSGSDGIVSAKVHTTGTLAAVWYFDQGSMGLVGRQTNGGAITGGVSTQPNIAGAKAQFIASDAAGNFHAVVSGSNYGRKITFNLTPGNKNHLRRVFNTNPTLTNESITSTNSRIPYWLGESYEYELSMMENSGSGLNYQLTASSYTDVGAGANHVMINAGFTESPKYFGVILGIAPYNTANSTSNHSSHLLPFRQGKTNASGDSTNSATGWFYSQDMGGGANSGSYHANKMQKLFKFHGLDLGAWVQDNVKVSITNLDYSTNEFYKYGKFDVLVRRIDDTDRSPVVLERYSNCNLDPNSLDYIARQIGDRYVTFDNNDRRLVEKGMYRNRSKYIRIEMNTDVDAGTTNEEFLPFGMYGPVKYKNWRYLQKGAGPEAGTGDVHHSSVANTYAMVRGGNKAGAGTDITQNAGLQFISGACGLTGQIINEEALDVSQRARFYFVFPSVALRMSASQDNLANPADAFFGAWTGRAKTNPVFNPGIKDLIKPLSDGTMYDTPGPNNASYLNYMWTFSLDEVRARTGSVGVVHDFTYVSGSRVNNAGITNKHVYAATNNFSTGSSYKDILDLGCDSFTALFYGGTDGLDITEKEPFRNTLLADKTEKSHYTFNTIKEAIDIIKDPEVVEYNLAAVPGVTHEGLTYHLLQTVEDRADALAVIDLKGDFQPSHEGNDGRTYGSVTTVVNNLKDRAINSSYGCVYYPWVQIRDTLYGNLVFVPPSVAAIGAMSYTDRVKAPWFAPAGFNRGGLTSGVAGLPVINVTDKLTSKDRDKLYDANINPIASFPNEGIVIFGQKTLQITRSALDRINVRRLLLFVKKGVSAIASDILFEPNVRETWDRFINRANPFLADVKARFGLTDYKLVLDETTTTPDLIDQNILYAKVFLKPARAIEFIAVDFIITNTGAAFED